MDAADQIRLQVEQACGDKKPLNICGGDSKHFLGVQTDADKLTTVNHSGIISYEPSELVVTARAGTTLAALHATLADNHQMLPFEPPAFGAKATIGGTIACGLSGPSRPYIGAARDFVLGCTIVNGHGKRMSFGGQVMKNVAGYDVTRLMTGAMGTLGVLLDVSMKVLPVAESETTMVQSTDAPRAIETMQSLAGMSLPVTASAYYEGQLYYRLAGPRSAINAAATQIGGDALGDNDFWHSLREHQHEFFTHNELPLWRLSLPALTPDLTNELGSSSASMLYDWAGTQRWIATDADATHIRNTAARAGGHAQLFRGKADLQKAVGVNHPPAAAIMKLHHNLKREFDPAGILNPGRLYAEL